ncbi:MAG: type II toxin-antitoxin system VapC family toxin [Sulfuritalea sp.]|nr:type II toxin-antitoxin system VapC family toxin [Sulfuritalea sp.]
MWAFFDTSALIYLIEGREPLATAVRDRLAGLVARHDGVGVALSRLTWLEARVGPMKANDAGTLQRYDDFFARPDLRWVEMTRDVVELAAAVRVRHSLRTPDALQAACCLQLGAKHWLLTGDAAFERVEGLNVVLLRTPQAPP